MHPEAHMGEAQPSFPIQSSLTSTGGHLHKATYPTGPLSDFPILIWQALQLNTHLTDEHQSPGTLLVPKLGEATSPIEGELHLRWCGKRSTHEPSQLLKRTTSFCTTPPDRPLSLEQLTKRPPPTLEHLIYLDTTRKQDPKNGPDLPIGR